MSREKMCAHGNDAQTCWTCEQLAKGSFAAPSGSAAWRVIIELEGLYKWVKDGSGYVRDDAPDEIARAILNRIREIKASMTEAPPNNH